MSLMPDDHITYDVDPQPTAIAGSSAMTLPIAVEEIASLEDKVQDGDKQYHDRVIVVPASEMTQDLIGRKKRKNKSKRPASKRGLNKPTGFEDNFADAPLTIEEHAELRELFDCELPFVERIERAVHRFERTRKLSPQRRDIFFKYLAYGGFDIGPNMFQGQQNVAEMEKEMAIAVSAQTRLSDEMKRTIYDPRSMSPVAQKGRVGDQELEPEMREIYKISDIELNNIDERYKYIIDFRATMCAFLSRRAPPWFGMDTTDGIDLVTSTLERFMDYLLQHDVCPEYAEEVWQTRNVCREARIEMKSYLEAQKFLPGEFNIACSTLFGGSYGRDYDGVTFWGDTQPGESVFVGLTTEKASQIIGFAMATAADDIVYQRYAGKVEDGGSFEVARKIEGHGFEITGIERATDECYQIYHANTNDYRPVGKIRAKFWKNPDSPPEDLTDEERTSLGSMSADSRKLLLLGPEIYDEEYEFYIDDSSIMPYLRVGQKVECTIHQMKEGFRFFDEVIRIYPTFDIWIENELVYDARPPVTIDNLATKLVDNAIRYEEEPAEGGRVNAHQDQHMNILDQPQVAPDNEYPY